MNNQTQHTPTYWNFEKEYGRYIITGSRGQFIGSICSLSPKPNRDKANAEHIVKCVNMHDDFILELKSINAFLEQPVTSRLMAENEITVIKNRIKRLLEKANQ